MKIQSRTAEAEVIANAQDFIARDLLRDLDAYRDAFTAVSLENLDLRDTLKVARNVNDVLIDENLKLSGILERLVSEAE